MDEAASRLRMQVDSKPEELDEIDRRIMQLQIEREALKKETDQASKDRLVKLEKELAEFEEKSAGMTRRWQEEKEQLASASKVKEELEKARFDLEQAQRKGDFAKAGELAYATIPGLEKKLKEAEESSSSRMLEEAVTENHVAQVVSRWTGVPVDKMLEGEREKLIAMETELGQARHRPVRCGDRGVDRGPPFARRPAGSEPADRLVHVPGADGRRQDRAHQGAGRLPVRRRARDGAHRHVGIHGEALRLAADRRPSGLCRL